MQDKSPTPASTLRRARQIAQQNGVRYAYTGNVHDEEGASTYCHLCGERVIGRDWYKMTAWGLTADGRCRTCHEACAGIFEGRPGGWNTRRLSVSLAASRE